MHIGVAIFTKNCFTYTANCIGSFQTNHTHTLLVVDDFSSDGTKEWLREVRGDFQQFAETRPADQRLMQDFLIVEDLPVPSLAARWNHAVRVLKDLGCDAVLLCNNDILFHPDTVDRLIARFEESRAAQYNDIAMVTAHNMRDEIEPDLLNDLEAPDVATASEAPHPDFSCMLLDIAAWEKVGGFEEGYVPCYFEDNDFHIMLKIHGFKAISTTAAPYYHFGSVTQNQKRGGVCTSELFNKNREFFIDKFGGMPKELDIEELRTRFLGDSSVLLQAKKEAEAGEWEDLSAYLKLHKDD